MSNSFDYSDDEGNGGFEFCSRRTSVNGVLPFDPSSIEQIILKIGDQFNFRVLISDERAKGALLVTTGLALAGGIIGRAYGGKLGAAVGGAVGGACGLGIVAVSLRDIWEDVRSKLAEVFDIVYDYLAGLGLEDYRKAAVFLTEHYSDTNRLALLVLQASSDILGKKMLSSITSG